ncbi:MAG TPA: YciI family protein [Dyella sp.]|uniref:YciI family protein n=1 Tax=Dyella sp. TaxID=1869338 RepID=UPI002BEBC8B2|nr:YciI family protein [Dyella sp.]HTV85168.1 YciI family protein [Dyella sp.]
MRFMMLMLPADYSHAAPDIRPSLESIERMMQYNFALQRAGVLLALDGLHPPSSGGARVSSVDGKTTVTDGPFAEAKEAIGGYWVLDVASREEALAWAARCPLTPGETIELRQMFEMTDFSPDVQQAVMKLHAQHESAT